MLLGMNGPRIVELFSPRLAGLAQLKARGSRVGDCLL